MLHASVRINVNFLIGPRSTFALIPLRILVQIHYSSEMCKDYTHTCTHKQILQENSCLHVYLHIVIRVREATQTEDPMNSADKSGWRPARGKSVFHLLWMQVHCAAWDYLLVWSTDPIFRRSFLSSSGSAGPSGLAQRLKNRDTRIMLCTGFTMGRKQGQGEQFTPDKPHYDKKDQYKNQCLDSGALKRTKHM